MRTGCACSIRRNERFLVASWALAVMGGALTADAILRERQAVIVRWPLSAWLDECIS